MPQSPKRIFANLLLLVGFVFLAIDIAILANWMPRITDPKILAPAAAVMLFASRFFRRQASAPTA